MPFAALLCLTVAYDCGYHRASSVAFISISHFFLMASHLSGPPQSMQPSSARCGILVMQQATISRQHIKSSDYTNHVITPTTASGDITDAVK